MLIPGICLIFNFAILGFIAEITLYLAGIMLIIVGVVSLVNNRQSRYAFYIGIAGVLLGLIYIIIGTYVTDLRLKQMIDDGTTDYIISASISLDEIKSKAQKFIDEGNFVRNSKKLHQ